MDRMIDSSLVLLTPTEMAEADRMTIAGGTPGLELMERAGYAVADAVSGRHPQGTRVAIACGPGNNGGDGFVAARVLAARGYVVRLGLAGSVERLTGDAAAAAGRFRGLVEPAVPALLSGAAVVIDALFGAGLARPLDGAAATLVGAMAEARRRGAEVIAVDLPSGVDGRTGAVPGPAVEADRTVTFFRAKPGHLLLPGRRFVGRLSVADIGIAPAVLERIGPRTARLAPDLFAAAVPQPAIDQHKYSRGAVMVVSGRAASCGAARLAAAAALHGGAGIVTVAAPADAVALVAAYRAAFVVRPVTGAGDVAELLADRRLGAVVIGPGLGLDDEAEAILRAAVAGPAALVLDADGLTLAARSPGLAEAIRRRTAPTVATPHEGEFSRLWPDLSGARIDRARAAAADLSAVVVLKGPDSIVAAPDGRAAISEGAPAHLATAGSGDVLAGLAAAFLARAMPAFEAAAAAVWLHARAGEEAGAGLIADDLPAAASRVIGRGFPPGPG